jgi:hypothetical protein
LGRKVTVGGIIVVRLRVGANGGGYAVEAELTPTQEAA